MKKILLLFVAMICAVAGWAQEATVSATVSGEELTVSLAENGKQFVAFQMDIQLPAGVTVENDGTAITLMTDRLTQPGTASKIDASENVNFKVLYNVLPDNKVRVIAYNLDNREIGGTAGDPLFKVALQGTSEDAITVSNIKFVTKTQLEEVELPTVDAVTEEGFHPYDLNKSGGDPDIDDAVLLLNHIVTSGAYVKEYDLNNDTAVDVDDAVIILNYIVTL